MRYISFTKSGGSKCAMLVDKTARYRERNSTTLLRKTCNILIVGAHNSGKTRYVKKLCDNAEVLYRGQCRPYAHTTNHTFIKNRRQDKKVCQNNCSRAEIEKNWKFPEPVFIRSQEALSDWANHDGVSGLYEKEMLLPFQKATLKVKGEWIAKYLKETNAILFIDDVDKLTGRKLQVVKEMLSVSFRVIYTARAENVIHPSIRIPVLESEPQIVRLESNMAYDITPYFIFILITIITTLISPELAVLVFIAGIGKFAQGQFATRQK